MRVLSLRSSAHGERLVGLTLHTERLNPTLHSPAQLLAPPPAAAMDVSDGVGGAGVGGVGGGEGYAVRRRCRRWWRC